MARFGFLSPDDARLVLDAARVLRNSGWTLPGQVPAPPRDTPANIIVHNDSGATIPAWACMQVTGTEDLGPITMLVVDQPADTDGTTGGYVFNGPNEIETDQDGMIQRGNIVRAYKNTGTVSSGQKWRPTVSQWYLTQDDDGQFTACGDDQVDTDVFRIFFSNASGGGITLWRFTLNEDMGATTANEAAADLLELDGTDTTNDVTVLDPLAIFSALEDTDAGYVLEQGGSYYIIQAPCPGGNMTINGGSA